MKWLQYIVLIILTANGSLPILEKYNLDFGLIEEIPFFNNYGSTSQDPVDQGTSEEDVQRPRQHVYKEPKPNEVELPTGIAALNIRVYQRNDLELLQSARNLSNQAHINKSLLKRVYFSKSSVDPSCASRVI